MFLKLLISVAIWTCDLINCLKETSLHMLIGPEVFMPTFLAALSFVKSCKIAATFWLGQICNLTRRLINTTQIVHIGRTANS